MKIEATIYCEFPDDKREAFVLALSEKINELINDGWDISLPVLMREATDKSIKTGYLLLSNKEENNG